MLLAREASKKVKVVLTGEGADELFAGYAYQHTEEFADPDALHGELVRGLEQLHGLNLQRCDRTTMFYGLEAREPSSTRRWCTARCASRRSGSSV